MGQARPAEAEQFNDAETTLKILDALAENGAKSQRALAGEAEIALGLANAYLKRCVRKGWIKVRAAPARRFLYYVTPRGFSEKARLTTEYLSNSFDLFRTARGQCDSLIENCAKIGYRRIALIGVSDLAEIAVLSGMSGEIEIVAVVDSTSNQPKIAGIPVVRSLAETMNIDAVVITDIRTPQQTFETLLQSLPAERVLSPAMLRVERNRTDASIPEAGE